MAEIEKTRPWEQAEFLLNEGADDALKTYISSLSVEDQIALISHLDHEAQTRLMQVVDAEMAAELLDQIPRTSAVEVLTALPADNAGAILTEFRSDEQADFIGQLKVDGVEEIMTQLPRDSAEQIRQLIEYDPETAGGLMIKEFLVFDEKETVGDLTRQLQENAEQYEKYNVQYVYVKSGERFIGVLRLRDLLLSSPRTRLAAIVLKGALTVLDTTPLTELIQFFDEHDFYGVPVINTREEMVGVVLRKRVREIETDKYHLEHLEMQGIVGGEELRSMPVWLRSRRRLSWLSVNILLNIMAASIIAIYAETLEAVIALAVFLPVISDMSGCSGNQAVAVSMRELSLGVARTYDVFRVWIQEISVGIINGLTLGVLIGLAAWMWKGNPFLGLVVGGALAINTLVAVSLGGILPLALKHWKVDPALASGPILTTVTDMMGFFLALSFAGIMIDRL